MRALYRTFIALTGGAGLATAIGYFLGIYLTFRPGWKDWQTFFVPHAVEFVAIPCALLLVYLYLRSHWSQWQLEHGYVDEAMAYASNNLTRTLLRGRREALLNRLALGRGHVHKGDYSAAWDVLTEGFGAHDPGFLVLPRARWRMEAALRMDNLVKCHQAYDEVADVLKPRRARANVAACRAELAAREGKASEYEEAMSSALWADADNVRAKLSRAMGLYRFGKEPQDHEEALALLAQAAAPICREVPQCRGELEAVRAELMFKQGHHDQATTALEQAAQLPSDGRADYVRRTIERSHSLPDATDADEHARPDPSSRS